MKIEPLFGWNEDTGLATCITTYNGKTFYGEANCHPDDGDMKSEKTGCQIAFMRARICCLRHMRDCEIKPELAALKQLYYSMNTSKKFNPKSYENKMLQRQIRQKEFDLDAVQEMITTEQQRLKSLIEEKDKFYKRVRANREQAKR